MVRMLPSKTLMLEFKSQVKVVRDEAWAEDVAQWQSKYLACRRPQVQFAAPQEDEKIIKKR